MTITGMGETFRLAEFKAANGRVAGKYGKLVLTGFAYQPCF